MFLSGTCRVYPASKPILAQEWQKLPANANHAISLLTLAQYWLPSVSHWILEFLSMILIRVFLNICGLSYMDQCHECVIHYEIQQQSTHEEGVLIESHYHANHCQHWPCITRQWYAIKNNWCSRVPSLIHVYIESSMNLLHTVNIILFMYSTGEHDILYVCCNFDFTYFICCGMRQISMVFGPILACWLGIASVTFGVFTVPPLYW